MLRTQLKFYYLCIYYNDTHEFWLMQVFPNTGIKWDLNSRRLLVDSSTNCSINPVVRSY